MTLIFQQHGASRGLTATAELLVKNNVTNTQYTHVRRHKRQLH